MKCSQMGPVLAGSLSVVPAGVSTGFWNLEQTAVVGFHTIDCSAWELTNIFIQNLTKIISIVNKEN